jgi:hypothetical protein
VEAEDFLADEVEVGRPKFGVLHGADVVDEGVEPDVGYVLSGVAVNGERDAPFDGGAGDGEVLQASADEGEDFGRIE